MINWLYYGAAVIGAGYIGYKKWKNIDIAKIGLDDAKELLEMVTEFATGGEDGIINETDVIILIERLKEIIEKNSKEDAL